jgi:acetolactate decarboxylase
VRRSWTVFLVVPLLLGAMAFGCCFAGQGTLTQVSTIDALMTGIYDGETTLAALREKGDFGLGTFNALNGEMILLDGKFYRIRETGRVETPAPAERTPFAAVTFFRSDKKLHLQTGLDLRQFAAVADSLLPTANIFYAIKITGLFQKVRTRSEPAQEKPYRPLEEVLKTQPTFNLESIRGTVVGFRCPPYVKGINVPGYHLHFVASDFGSGGHVLDFVIKDAVLDIAYVHQFSLILPPDRLFYDADLTPDREKELKAVEN